MLNNKNEVVSVLPIKMLMVVILKRHMRNW